MDSLRVRHVVLVVMCISICNNLVAPRDVSLNELNAGAGLLEDDDVVAHHESSKKRRRSKTESSASSEAKTTPYVPRRLGEGGGGLVSGGGTEIGNDAHDTSRRVPFSSSSSREMREFSTAIAPPPPPSPPPPPVDIDDAEGDDDDDEDSFTPAKPRSEADPAGNTRGATAGCPQDVSLPTRAHWRVSTSTLADFLHHHHDHKSIAKSKKWCEWACVAGHRKVRVGEKQRCIPCKEDELRIPAGGQLVTDAGGSSCGWRCQDGYERSLDRRRGGTMTSFVHSLAHSLTHSLTRFLARLFQARLKYVYASGLYNTCVWGSYTAQTCAVREKA